MIHKTEHKVGCWHDILNTAVPFLELLAERHKITVKTRKFCLWVVMINQNICENYDFYQNNQKKNIKTYFICNWNTLGTNTTEYYYLNIYFLHSKHALWTTQQNRWQNRNSFHTSLTNCYKFVKFVIMVCWLLFQKLLNEILCSYGVVSWFHGILCFVSTHAHA